MLIYENSSPFVQNILLIDNTITDYQEVVESANNNTLAIVYDYDCTFEELSNILIYYHISRLGIFCHSKASFFNNKHIYTDVSGIYDLIQHFKIDNIDFLACNTLKIPEYISFYENLPCIVGASNDETGNIKYGGDWVMESTGEDIENIYFTKNIEYYTYLLDTSLEPFITASALTNSSSSGIIGAYGITKLNGCLIFSTTNSKGALIVYSAISSNSDNAFTGKTVFSISSSLTTSGYVAYGITSINLPVNGYALFTITTNLPSGSTYYLTYIKSTAILSGTTLLAGTGISSSTYTINARTNLQMYTFTKVNSKCGIISYQNNILFIGLTNGCIAKCTISETTTSKFPTCVVDELWCNTGLTSSICGMVIDTSTTPNYLYSINHRSRIYKINLTNGISNVFYDGIFDEGINGTSLSISNNWLFISKQTSTPTNRSTLGSGIIYKIELYKPGFTIVEYKTYSSYAPANFALYADGNNLYSLAFIQNAGGTTSTLASTTLWTTIVNRYTITDSGLNRALGSIISEGIVNFKANINGEYHDLSQLFNYKFDTISGLSTDTNFAYKNYDISILFDCSSTYLGVGMTNFYINTETGYEDISKYFTLSSKGNEVLAIMNNTIQLTNQTSDFISIINNEVVSDKLISNTTLSKIYYEWNLSTFGKGKCIIYGSDTYYILINGILSPYYSSNLSSPNELDFVYINGTNTIEIFTSGSIVAYFITMTEVVRNELFTSNSWNKNIISEFISSSTTKTDKMVRPSITDINSTGTIDPIQGGITTFSYNGSLGGGANSIINSTVFYNRSNLGRTNSYISTNIYAPFINVGVTIPGAESINNIGIKAVGYFCPPNSGTWIFSINADNWGIFTIGVSSTLPCSIYPTLSNIASPSQCVATFFPDGRTQLDSTGVNGITRTDLIISPTATVILNAGVYYPFLLYFAQDGGGHSLNVTVQNGYTVYNETNSEYKNLFYYLSSFPTY